MKKKIFLVTGSSGFIGSHFVQLLLKKKIAKQIICIDKKKNSLLKFNSLIKFCRIDISNFSNVKSIVLKEKPDFIINFAAETHVDKSIENSKKFIKSNIVGLYNFLEIIKNYRKKTRFMQISTDEVFGHLSLKSKKKFSLNSKYNPRNPYAATKASGDLLLKAYAETYSLDLILTNCSNNFGENQSPEKLIPIVIHQCYLEKKIPVYGNGKNIRDWIYVKDHTKILLNILLDKKSKKKQFLIGSNQELSNLDLIKKICLFFDKYKKKKYGYHSKLIKFVKDRAGHDLRYGINNKSSQKYNKIIKKNSFEKNIAKTINHYVQNIYSIHKKILNDKWYKKKYKNIDFG